MGAILAVLTIYAIIGLGMGVVGIINRLMRQGRKKK
jgi:hypothetical protein